MIISKIKAIPGRWVAKSWKQNDIASIKQWGDGEGVNVSHSTGELKVNTIDNVGRFGGQKSRNIL